MADLPLLNPEESMEIDAEKLEQTILALLYLNLHGDDADSRAWKSFPWSVLDALHEKGYISDPATRAQSIRLSAQGLKRSKELFDLRKVQIKPTPWGVAPGGAPRPVRTLPIKRHYRPICAGFHGVASVRGLMVTRGRVDFIRPGS